MKNQLLLLEDVDGLGRSGDIVTAKPGYARNFLFPKKKAIRAEKHLVKLQERLKEERAKKALEDKKEFEKLAKELVGKTLVSEVKIDAEGHMYGSVTAIEILHLMKDQLGVELEKKHVALPKPIRKLGSHEVELKLPEGVAAKVEIEIRPEEKPAEA